MHQLVLLSTNRAKDNWLIYFRNVTASIEEWVWNLFSFQVLLTYFVKKSLHFKHSFVANPRFTKVHMYSVRNCSWRQNIGVYLLNDEEILYSRHWNRKRWVTAVSSLHLIWIRHTIAELDTRSSRKSLLSFFVVSRYHLIAFYMPSMTMRVVKFPSCGAKRKIN